MDPDELFLATLDDLAARIVPGRTAYDVLQIAALLRKLLLDDTRLVDRVNRSRRVPVRFTANVRPPRNGALVWSIQDGLDPDTAAPLSNNSIRELNRDQFLAVPIIVAGGERLTVADTVRFLANVAGAVHLGVPTTPKENALAGLGATVQLGGYSPDIRSLLAVSRVVAKALEPLRLVVENDRDSQRF